MAANSLHPGDIILWIQKIIDSCETPGQINTTLRIIERYRKHPYYDCYQVLNEYKHELLNLEYKCINKKVFNHK